MAINSILKTPQYPQKWEMEKVLPDGKSIFIRPVKPEDEPLLVSFIEKCDPEDARQRLFTYVHSLPHSTASLLTNVDYHRTMSFVAIDKKSGELLGITHMVHDRESARAEYAVITRSDVKHHGIAAVLTKFLIDYAVAEGVSELFGQVMRDNTTMIKICENLGINLTTDKDEPIYLMATLKLDRNKKLGI